MAASVLKRWLNGTHQGGVQHQHLDYYLDEFAFRFNRRHSKARGLLFHRLAQQAVAVDPPPYPPILGTKGPAKPPEVSKGNTPFLVILLPLLFTSSAPFAPLPPSLLSLPTAP